jgi:hypothetical protein
MTPHPNAPDDAEVAPATATGRVGVAVPRAGLAA